MDRSYNYCHISHSNHTLYATKWLLESLSHDDIDTDHLLDVTALLFPDEDDDILLPQMKTIGKRKRRLQKPIWDDFSLEKFSSENDSAEEYKDRTLIRSMFTADDETEGINEFLSNGYNHINSVFTHNGLSAIHLPPPLAYEQPSFATPATPRIRALLGTLLETPRVRQALVHTPRIPSGTPRRPSGTPRLPMGTPRNQTPFQTPITRIMR